MTGTMPLSPQSGITAKVQRLEEIFNLFQQDQGSFASIINTYIAYMVAIIGAIEATIRYREAAIQTAFDVTAAQRASEFAAVVAQAKSEFDTQRQQLQTITGAVQTEFTKLQEQIEQGAAREPGHKFGKGFLPVKGLKPPKLVKEEQWRDWAEHFS